jgi:hypothetical protein
VLAYARSEFGAALGGEFFGIVQAHNPPSRIQNYGGSDNRTEERAPSGFINSSDAQPATLPRFTLISRATKSPHRLRILAHSGITRLVGKASVFEECVIWTPVACCAQGLRWEETLQAPRHVRQIEG